MTAAIASTWLIAPAPVWREQPFRVFTATEIRAEVIGRDITRTGRALVSAAARDMGMSYKRAWLMLDSMNQAFTEPVITAAPGGAGGGGATLTAFGAEVLERYRRIHDRAAATAADDVAALMRHATLPRLAASLGRSAGLAAHAFVYAPACGRFETRAQIGDRVEESAVIAMIAGDVLRAPVGSVIQGLTRNGVEVAIRTGRPSRVPPQVRGSR